MRNMTLNQVIARKDINVFSFDIFDTVLTRLVSPPNVVFAQTAEQGKEHLPTDCSTEQFVFLREQADARARKWHGDAKTLEDIYRELRKSLHLSAAEAKRIKEIELAIEKKVLYPVPRIQSIIQKLREDGAQVVFSSDMYLPSSFLRERLVEHDIWEVGDDLFVSCEYGFQKSEGGLFKPMLQEVQANKKQALHIGNCEYADVKEARQAGIHAVHFDAGNTNRYESILAKYVSETRGLTGHMAGASRYARLHTEVSSSREQALRDVAAGVMAPILSGFVLWILRQTRERSLDRLYFTSRDGHALVPIAHQLADALDVDCEFNYIYLSRASLTAANPDSEVLYNMLEFEDAGGEDVLSRFDLSMEDILPHLPSENARQHVKSRPLTERGKQLIASTLSQIGNNAVPDSNQIANNRQLLRSYLKREGLHEKGRFGFVDIGWKGSVHSLLNDFLQQEDLRTSPLPAYLFGLSTPQQPYASHRTAYFFDEYREHGHRNVLNPGSAIYTIMEVFCTADHGTVTGYKRVAGTVEPTLEPTWPERMEEWGLPVVRRTLDAFLDGLSQYPDLLETRVDPRHAFARLLEEFWQNPSKDEAEAWGSFPREMGQANETTLRPLAPPYGWTSLPTFARHGPEAAHTHLYHKFSWPAGSLSRSSQSLRAWLDIVIKIRKSCQRVYHITKRTP